MNTQFLKYAWLEIRTANSAATGNSFKDLKIVLFPPVRTRPGSDKPIRP
jgi:hypothetical protein